MSTKNSMPTILRAETPPTNILVSRELAIQILEVWNPSGKAKAAEFWLSSKNQQPNWSPICLNSFNKEAGCAKEKGVGCARLKGCTARDNACLTIDLLLQHINGPANKRKGIYPLLQDGTTFWIAADLDNHGGTTPAENDVKEMIKVCKVLDIPLFVFSSSSGKGYHTYIFFDYPVPAEAARRLMTEIAIRAKTMGQGVKESSLDAFFPKQDKWKAGLDFGNLIALPFNGALATEKRATLYLDSELKPLGETLVDNVELFLEYLQRMTKDAFEGILKEITHRQCNTGVLPKKTLSQANCTGGDVREGESSDQGDDASDAQKGAKNQFYDPQAFLSSKVSKGARNASLTRFIGWLWRVHKKNREVVEGIAKATNRDVCVPPLSDYEVEKIVSSIERRDSIVEMAETTGIPIDNIQIRQYPDSRREYIVHANNRAVTMDPGEVDDFNVFKRKLVTLTNRVLPRLKHNDWCKLINPVLVLAEDEIEFVNEEETQIPELRAILKDGMVLFEGRAAGGTIKQWIDAPDSSGVFTSQYQGEEYIFISIRKLMRRVVANPLLRSVKQKEVGGMLKSIGFMIPTLPLHISQERFPFGGYHMASRFF